MTSLDDDARCNVFARAMHDSGGDLALALRAVVHAEARGTNDVGAVGLNAILASVAREAGMPPGRLLGRNTTRAVCAARRRVLWLAHQRGLTEDALAIAFGRSQSTISEQLGVFEAEMRASAELRARMTWEAASWARAA